MTLNPIYIPFTGIAVLFLIDEGTLLLRALASRSWSKTTGRVLEAGSTHLSGRGEGLISYPFVRYEYQVGSRTYGGDRLTFNGQIGIRLREIRREAARLAHSKQIDVYYDPAHPDRSVLEPGADAWNYACAALGLILTVFLLRMLWLPH